jgi:hypothetical protein
MAKASVTYRYDDDESLTCEVECDASYPDAIDQDAMRYTSDLNDEAKPDGEAQHD